MDVQRIFHMKGGHGDTSYASNSSLQKKGSDLVKHLTVEAIQDVYRSTAPRSVAIADIGCSSGPNTLSIVRDLYRAVEIAYRSCSDADRQPEVVVYLNDLPSNDFNSIFRALPDLHAELQSGEDRNGGADCKPSLFVSALAGSFYGRLFPCNSLHFVYSSYSLHWLSKIPPGIYDENGNSMNKGSICISQTSPPAAIQAYERQFREDFSSFLQLRSQELVKNGRMVLLFLGRQGPNHVDRGNSFLWELLTQSFNVTLSKGLVEQEKLDSYEVHFYAASRDEIEEVVQEEGSFAMERLEPFCVEQEDRGEHGASHGVAVARAVRAIQESLLSHHFGQVRWLDQLFETYAALIDQETAKEAIRPVTYALVLAKI